MKTKTLLSIAIIAALPMAATAENISGAMYAAPARHDTNHPAPTTSADPLYGRVNIDTADQEHIATTAYVKGAYNSAIAAVNKSFDLMDNWKQTQLEGIDGHKNIHRYIFDDGGSGFGTQIIEWDNETFTAVKEDIGGSLAADENNPNNALISAGAVFDIVRSAGTTLQGNIDAQRVTIYTTWDDDSANATTQVALSTAQ